MPSERVPSARSLVACACLAASLVLAGCAAGGAPDAAKSTSSSKGIVKVVPQRDWSDAVLYFVILDRYADGDGTNDDKVDRNNPGGWHGGDLKGLTAHLDEISSLGATAIWITPVVQQIAFCPPSQAPVGVTVPGGWFEHCAFHGYWADDFTKLDPHYGSEADLKALVDAAHARGMKVLLDVVYNHVGYDAHYLHDPATRDWVRTQPVDCAADAIHCQVGGLPDLKTELPAVQDYLLAAHLGLARRTGLDGFRLDTVKHVEHEFWRRHREETRTQLGPDFFLLAEVWGGSATVLDEYFADDEMNAGFDFTFKGSCEAFVQGKGRTVAFASLPREARQGARRPLPGALPLVARRADGARQPRRRQGSVQALRRAADDVARHPDDLLRRGSGARRQHLAAQPRRHALGQARGAARQGPRAATRTCAPTTSKLIAARRANRGAVGRRVQAPVVGRRPAGVRAQRRRGRQRRGRRDQSRQDGGHFGGRCAAGVGGVRRGVGRVERA